MFKLKEPMLTMPKFKAKWAPLVRNGVILLFTLQMDLNRKNHL